MRSDIDEEQNLAHMLRGGLYYAFTPQLIAARKRCKRAVNRLNNAGELTRRQVAEHWKEITNSNVPLPPVAPTEEEEDAVLHKYPWIEQPIRVGYGTNIIVGSNVFIDSNCTIIDACLVSIGSRTLLGPNVSFYTDMHPIDPEARDGRNGPESGRPIVVGADCWLGGNVIVLPGVTIGDGCTIGAGSVVTKDVPAYHVAAGNPAKTLHKINKKATQIHRAKS